MRHRAAARRCRRRVPPGRAGRRAALVVGRLRRLRRPQRARDAAAARSGAVARGPRRGSCTRRRRRCTATSRATRRARPTCPKPFSPYGVTKLAAEHLCGLYAENSGVPTVSLRYFTVFGPRQRPDMSIHRLCEAAIARHAVPALRRRHPDPRVHVRRRHRARQPRGRRRRRRRPARTCNLAGGGEITLNDLIDARRRARGRAGRRSIRGPRQAGDSFRNGGAIDRARELLGWEPEVSLRDGLAAQLAWHRVTRGSRRQRERARLRSTVTALPVSSVRSPATRHVHRAAACGRLDARTARSRPRRSHQYGASTQCIEPVTGSSSMPTRGREAARHDVVHAVVAGRGHVDAAHVGERAQRGEVGRRASRTVAASGTTQHEELAGRCDSDLGLREPERGEQPAGVGASAPARATGKSSCTAPSCGRVARSSPLRVWNAASASGGEAAGFPEHVRARERRVPAEVDLDLGREPAQVEPAVGPGRTKAVSECFISAATACIQRRRSPSASSSTTAAGLPRNGPDGERVDDEDRPGHRPSLPPIGAGRVRFWCVRSTR